MLPADLDALLDEVLEDVQNKRGGFDFSDLSILDKKQQTAPLRPNRVQQDFLDHMTGRDLILKSRQQGISTIVQAFLFKTAAAQTTRVGTLAHDDNTTQKLRDMQQFFYKNLPDSLKPHRAINNATRIHFPDTESMMYTGTAGNTATGRGGTYSHVHGSEVAFWKDAGSLMSGLMQGVPENGWIALESTANGMSGWFYEQCMAALDGDSIWKLHFYPWWWDVTYRMALTDGEVIHYTPDEQALVDEHKLDADQIKWRRYKMKELPQAFKQEYPEDPHSCFLASGLSYFGDIGKVFTAPRHAAPIPGHRYVAGLDFAQTTDYTAMIVIDETTRQMVDLLHINKLSWQEMRRQVAVMANYWGALVTGEANSMGTTNIELLQSGESGYAVKLNPFQTTAQSKPPLIQALHHALHEGGLTLWDEPALRHELQAFISRQTSNGGWAYEAGQGAHDDLVMALALAWWGIVAGGQMRIEKAPESLSSLFGGFGNR